MLSLLSGNALKLIAAFTMLIDHAGLLLFPEYDILRVIGRLSFPIYAFMIAEGCKYTRNRLRYFLSLFLLGSACQVVYFFFDGSLYFSVLITFSLSILMIYAMQNFKRSKSVFGGLIFACAVAGVYALNRIFAIDYGFWGCMLPVFAALLHHTKYDSLSASIGMLGIGLVLLALSFDLLQFYALLALPLLWCYSGKRGKWNMKYFFYIFYPLHLVILQGIAMLK